MRDFAPISSGPSVRLHFAAGYFAFTGGSALVLLILAMATAAAGNVTLRAALSAHPFGPLLRIASALLLLATSYLLYRRSRLGGILAIALFVPPLVGRAVGEPVSGVSLAIAAVGVIIVLSVWRELNGELSIVRK